VEEGWTATFTLEEKQPVVYLKKDMTLIKGFVHNKLFCLRTEELSLLADVKLADPSSLWHRRLGHVAPKTVKTMVPELKEILASCDACGQGKIKKLPHKKKETTRATLPGERIMIDGCGPVKPRTTNKKGYFYLITDDASRVRHVSIVKARSEALSAFQKFEEKYIAPFNHKIRVWRCDPAPELAMGSWPGI
jgi:hypothetical protein